MHRPSNRIEMCEFLWSIHWQLRWACELLPSFSNWANFLEHYAYCGKALVNCFRRLTCTGACWVETVCVVRIQLKISFCLNEKKTNKSNWQWTRAILIDDWERLFVHGRDLVVIRLTPINGNAKCHAEMSFPPILEDTEEEKCNEIYFSRTQRKKEKENN